MKLLVVGLGSIGRRHAANAANMAQLGVFDRDEALCRKIASEQNALGFSSLEEGLAWKPDGVVVAAPHEAHLSVATQAVLAGADVLIEKPISHTEDGVREFLDLSRSLHRRVFVVCNMRYHPAIDCVAANLPRIGQALFARAQYGNYLPNMRPGRDYREVYSASRERGGGVILDSIHEIDYLAWLFGPIEAVSCEAGRLSSLDIDVEDYASVQLTHATNVRSEVHLDFLQQFKRRGLEVVGTKGTLIWTSEGKAPEAAAVSLYDAEQEQWSVLLSSSSQDANQAYALVLEDFLRHLRDGDPGRLLDGERAFAALRVALGARHSAEIGQRIRLGEN